MMPRKSAFKRGDPPADTRGNFFIVRKHEDGRVQVECWPTFLTLALASWRKAYAINGYQLKHKPFGLGIVAAWLVYNDQILRQTASPRKHKVDPLHEVAVWVLAKK